MKTKSLSIIEKQNVSKLEAVRQSFEDWRMTREKFGPIPTELWSAAVELTESYPVTKVSQSLRLNYADLKKRANPSVSSILPKRKNPSGTAQASGSEFVDIFPIGNLPTKDPLPECSMEIRDRDGLSMKMHCRGEACVDVLELCRIVMDSR